VTTAPDAKFRDVASSNWYVFAPGTGFQANDGVSVKVSADGSSARSMNPCRSCGAAKRMALCLVSALWRP